MWCWDFHGDAVHRHSFPHPLFQISCLLSISHVQLFATLWTVAHQAPLSMKLSRQEYWSGLPFPSPGIFLSQGSNPGLLHCTLVAQTVQKYAGIVVSSINIFDMVINILN